jgi:hypothetical protein
VFTTPDESTKYVGDWVNDLREGKGILTDATGVYNGDWANDMVSPPPHPSLFYVFANTTTIVVVIISATGRARSRMQTG